MVALHECYGPQEARTGLLPLRRTPVQPCSALSLNAGGPARPSPVVPRAPAGARRIRRAGRGPSSSARTPHVAVRSSAERRSVPRCPRDGAGGAWRSRNSIPDLAGPIIGHGMSRKALCLPHQQSPGH